LRIARNRMPTMIAATIPPILERLVALNLATSDDFRKRRPRAVGIWKGVKNMARNIWVPSILYAMIGAAMALAMHADTIQDQMMRYSLSRLRANNKKPMIERNRTAG